ncbi:MAG: acyl-CoA dehydrogenase family protein, partial [Oscillospiraceae bacterium]
GQKIAMQEIGEVGRAGMAIINVGILRGVLEEGIKFSNERILYGKPIAKLQSVQFELADIRVDYEAAKRLAYAAFSKKDAGLPAALDFSVAKLFATEGAVRSSKRCMDLMGGYGVINEYPVGRYMRDALCSIAAGGTSHVQRLVIAGQTLNGFKP